MQEDHDRVYRLEGAANFRHFGGYRTNDGGCVRSGLLYRTGALAGITPADQLRLAALDIAYFFDLRTTGERARAPLAATDWLKAYRTRDYEMSYGQFRFDRADDPDPQELRGQIEASYRILPYEQAPAYRELMLAIAAGDLPILIGCSAGKDRTGIFAAILLDLLGVDRATIIEDYCGSNAFADAVWAAFATVFPSEHQRSRAPWEPMVSCEPRYIEATLETLTENHGSTAGFCKDVLELDHETMAELRQRLIAPGV